MLKRWLLSLLLVVVCASSVSAQEYRTNNGTLDADEEAVSMSLAKIGTVSVQIAGNPGGGTTVKFEVTNDRILWYPLEMYPPDSGVGVTEVTTVGAWSSGKAAAFQWFRARIDTYGSGTLSVSVSGVGAAASRLPLSGDDTTFLNGIGEWEVPAGGGGGGAPTDAKYIVQQSDAGLSAEQSLGALGTALLQNTTTTGVLSAYAGASCTNQFVRSLSAVGAATCATVGTNDIAASVGLTTPNIGTPSAGVLTNATGLPIASGVSGLGSGVATFLATPTGANFASMVTGETGTGVPVMDQSPTIVTPTIASMTNAQHNHTNAAGGGKLASTALNGDLGYSLQFAAGGGLTWNPADATTYYMANYAAFNPTTNLGRVSVIVPRAGTVTWAQLITMCNTNGSNQQFTISISVNEGATTENITTTATWDAGVNTANIHTNASLNTAVATGDRLQISFVTPTWTTNPSGCFHNATVWIHQS